MARYMFIREGEFLGGSESDKPDGLLLEEQADGSWLRVDGRGDGGAALKEFHRRFPGMLHRMKDWGRTGESVRFSAQAHNLLFQIFLQEPQWVEVRGVAELEIGALHIASAPRRQGGGAFFIAGGVR